MAEVTAIIGAIATVLTVFIVPVVKWIKKIKNKKIEQQEKQKERDVLLNNLYKEVKAIKKQVDDNSSLKTTFDAYLEDYENFTVQNLKYMINDAFFGYADIHEIPDDVLTNACECCDIYVYKKKRNHEIKPRCGLLWKEQERRAIGGGSQDE